MLELITSALAGILLSNYTVLSGYRSFNEYRMSRLDSRLIKILDFKLFHCRACQSFWTTNIVGLIAGANPVLTFMVGLAVFKLVSYYDSNRM
jgi:hypothetical protein